MVLPTSGPISASMINIELGRAANAPFSIGGSAERGLAQKPTGPISMSDFYGKSSIVREPATGARYDNNNQWRYGRREAPRIIWNGVTVATLATNQTEVTVHTVGSWTYYRGAQRASGGVIQFELYRIGSY